MLIAKTQRNLFIALILSGLAHLLFVFLQQDIAQDSFAESQLDGGLQLELIESLVEVEVQQQKVIAGSTPAGNRSSMPEVIESVQSSMKVPIAQTDKKNPEIKVAEKTTKTDVVEILPETDFQVESSQTEQEVSNSVPVESQSAKAEVLSLYVYRAINQSKRYPYRAKRQRRQGLVKLSFVMHPNGMITDIAVLESSQHKILDQAAQQAVNAISPFSRAQQYLSYKHQYNVDIDFRLN